VRRLSTEKRKAVLPGDPTVAYPFALPYGYEPVDGALVPTEDARRTVKLIFDEALRVRSVDEIVQSLQREHRIPLSGAEDWDPQLVESILSNPAYTGRWQGFGRVEPIVDADRWESAQERLPLLLS
jgi:hypothetical protein